MWSRFICGVCRLPTGIYKKRSLSCGVSSLSRFNISISVECWANSIGTYQTIRMAWVSIIRLQTPHASKRFVQYSLNCNSIHGSVIDVIEDKLYPNTIRVLLWGYVRTCFFRDRLNATQFWSSFWCISRTSTSIILYKCKIEFAIRTLRGSYWMHDC